MDHTTRMLRLILAQQQIHPNDILYALFLKGVTPRHVAQACGVSHATVSLVVHGKQRSFNVATYIASQLGTTTRRLWGDAYDYTPRVRQKQAANG